MSAASISSQGDHAHTLRSTVLSAFEAKGWSVQRVPNAGSASRPDALLTEPSGRIRYVIGLKVLGANRRELLRSFLAAAAVEARVHADDLGAEPLAIVGTPSVSQPLAQELKRYADRYLPGVAVGWVDLHRNLLLSGAFLEEVGSSEPISVRPTFVGRSRAASFSLFSDLNQWMLKVLLADRIDENDIGAPKQRPRNARHLAEIASVSVPTAYRLVTHLKEHSFLETRPGPLRVVQIARLLDLWKNHLSLQVAEVPMKWVLPGREGNSARLTATLRNYLNFVSTQPGARHPRACLGLFAASDALGLSHVRGVAPHLYLEAMDDAILRRLKLRPSESGENADVFVRRPPAPEAVFRACVQRDGVYVSDALQCWLDVSTHPSRGAEQRDVFEERALRGLLADRVPAS